MKNFIFKTFLFVSLLMSAVFYGQCPDPVTNSSYFFFTNGTHQLRFTSQAQLDQFIIDFPNCTSIDYHTVIVGSGITSVLPLQNITHVKRLSITDAINLVSLNGLQNLTSISGQLSIKNSGLSNLQGLHNLASIGNTNDSSIGNNLLLETNSSLTSITALSNLNYLGGLSLTLNHVLTSLTGLENIQSEIPGSVSFNGGIVFSSMEALDGITSIGGILMIKDCPSLVSLSGLDELTSVGGQLQITNNDALVSLVSLENLNSAGDLLINANESLVSIEALSGMTSVNLGINIANNPNLASLNGLQNVTLAAGDPNYINSGVYIGYNNSLTSLNGLQGIVNLIGQLDRIAITNNANLSSLQGLNNLDKVRKLQITNNPLLTSLEGLEGLTKVEKLDILNNSALTTLNGLQNQLSIAQIYVYPNNTFAKLQIKNNTALPFCSIAPVCLFLSANGFSEIANNSNVCNSVQLILDNCPLCPLPGDLIFTSQQQLNDFILNYPSCTEINGNLTIGSLDGNTDITSLSALLNITSINGNLLIVNNPLLENLNGLNALDSVVGDVTIGTGNTLLTSINALGNLESIDGALQILYNPALTSLEGLEALNPLTISGLGLNIIGNGNLTFCSLPNICEYIGYDPVTFPRSISGNAAGCSSEVGLQAVCLGNLCPEGNVSFNSQAALDQFILDYPNCTEINGNLFISGATINNLAPLQNITSITGNITIHFCSNLLSLQPLENLESVGGNVYISTLINLNSLNGLQNLTQVGGSLSVVFNSSLTNLEGLEGIINITNNYIYIANNTSLASLSGLQNLNLDTITHLYIQDNPNLSNCSTLSNICEYLHNSGAATISGNTGECLNAVTVLNSCPTIWNGTDWNLSEPDENRNAVIEGDLTLVADLNTKNITLNSGIFTVSSGSNLTVSGGIINNGTPTDFVIESDGSLNQLNDLPNDAAITIKRNSFPLYNQDYTLWSSPVTAQNLRNFSPQTLFNRFYSYDTSAGTVGAYAQELFNNEDIQNKIFESAKGYLIRMPNNWPEFVNVGIAGTSYPAEFEGIPNNGTISIELSTANTGYNLVGNPYPSPISISTFFAGNSGIQQTLYFWRKRNGVAGSGYATTTELGLASAQSEVNGTDMGNTIKPGQGFFVKSTGSTSLTFTNTMRTSTQGTPFLRSANTTELHRFWLNLSDATNVVGQTLIGYTTGASEGFDDGIDAPYFNDSPLALTSLIGGNEHIIQGRSVPFATTDVVPLGFKSDVASNFTISLSNFDGLFSGSQDIFLKDNLTGALQNLKLGDYTFSSSIGIFNARFEVQFMNALGTDNPGSVSHKILVGVKDQVIKINAADVMIKKVDVVDVTGRVIYTQDDVNATTATIENLLATNQMLIVRITTQSHGVVNQKIIY